MKEQEELKAMRATLESLSNRLSEIEKKDKEINFAKGCNFIHIK